MARRTDEASLQAHEKYRKDPEKTKTKTLVFFLSGDSDILEHAEATGNFSGYVKALIRADMEKAKKDQQ